MADLTRLKLNFDDDAPREEVRRSQVSGLRLDFTDRWGTDAVVDLTVLNDRPGLAYAVALALSDLCEPDGTIKRLQTVKSYAGIIKAYLWPFLSSLEAQGSSPILNSQDIKTTTLRLFMNWLCQGSLGRWSSYMFYIAVTRILTHLRDVHPELVDSALEIPLFPSRGIARTIKHYEPYSDREVAEIERAARDEIRKTVQRLKLGAELLSTGRDPRTDNAWHDMANVLWFIKNELGGRYYTRAEMMASHRKLYYALTNIHCSIKEVYGYLYPLTSDLIPPLILVCLKTGINPQPALDLLRDCLKAVPSNGKAGITYTKYRPGPAPKTRMRIVDSRSSFGPGEIIRLFLRLTEECLQFVPEPKRNYLWLSLQTGTSAALAFQHLPFRTVSKEVKRFVSRNGLSDDNGKPFNLRLARLRTTWLTRRYKAAGRLADVRRDAEHERTQTTKGYVDNRQTLALHEQTIADALQDSYDSIFGKVFTQNPDSPEEVAAVAEKLRTTPERAESILRGEQDVFVATCKDFYNRPGGQPDTPCDRAWACFTCKNACWTSKTLPRLINFYDFITRQRRLLTAKDWEAKFGLPYTAITRYILPAFPPDFVDAARAAAQSEPIVIPISLRTI